MGDHRKRKQSRAAWTTVAVCVALLAAAGFSFRDTILGEWYTYQLESEVDAETSLRAVKVLRQLRYRRSLPALVELVQRNDAELEVRLEAITAILEIESTIAGVRGPVDVDAD